MASKLASVPTLPLDEAFALTAAYNADSHKDKVSLGAGVYRHGDGKPWVLPSVKKVSATPCQCSHRGSRPSWSFLTGSNP